MAFGGSYQSHNTFTATHFRGKPLTFVFGSNRRGVHGAGAARHAKQFFDAEYGVSEGLTGQSYALPTKNTPAIHDTLPLQEVLTHIEAFKQTARETPERLYQVTRVGCGLAGLKDFEPTIREAFLDAPNNCLLPGVWERERQPGMLRLVVAGSRDVTDYPLVEQWLDTLLARVDRANVCIISGLAPGPDRLGLQYAEARGLDAWHVPAIWDQQGKAAGFIRNQQMGWFGTHLAALWNGHSRGTQAMIQLADREGLTTRVKRCG